MSEENLRVSGWPRRNNVTLDVYAVNSEKVAVLRKQRGGYTPNLTRKRDELKSLLDNGVSVDRVRKKLEQARTALKDLYDFNVKLIQWLERAGMPEEVPSAELYYVEALKLADHRVSVSCALNLSSGWLEDDLNTDNSISRTTRSRKK